MNNTIIKALQASSFVNIGQWSKGTGEQWSEEEWKDLSAFIKKYKNTIGFHSFNIDADQYNNLAQEFNSLETINKLHIVGSNHQFAFMLNIEEMKQYFAWLKQKETLTPWFLFTYSFYLEANPPIDWLGENIISLLKDTSITQKFRFLKNYSKYDQGKFGRKFYKGNVNEIPVLKHPYVTPFEYIYFCLNNFQKNTREIQKWFLAGDEYALSSLQDSITNAPMEVTKVDFLRKYRNFLDEIGDRITEIEQKEYKMTTIRSETLRKEDYNNKNILDFLEYIPDLSSKGNNDFLIDVLAKFNDPDLRGSIGINQSYLEKMKFQIEFLRWLLHSYDNETPIHFAIEGIIKDLAPAIIKAIADLINNFFSTSLELLHMTLKFISERMNINQFTETGEIKKEFWNVERIIEAMNPKKKQEILWINKYVMKKHVWALNARDNIAHYNHSKDLRTSAVALIWLSCILASSYVEYSSNNETNNV